MLGGLLVVGLLVAGFGVANVLRPKLFAGSEIPERSIESDGGDPRSDDGLLLKNRIMGACCVLFGGIVAAAAVLG